MRWQTVAAVICAQVVMRRYSNITLDHGKTYTRIRTVPAEDIVTRNVMKPSDALDISKDDNVASTPKS